MSKFQHPNLQILNCCMWQKSKLNLVIQFFSVFDVKIGGDIYFFSKFQRQHPSLWPTNCSGLFLKSCLKSAIIRLFRQIYEGGTQRQIFSLWDSPSSPSLVIIKSLFRIKTIEKDIFFNFTSTMPMTVSHYWILMLSIFLLFSPIMTPIDVNIQFNS